MVTLMTNKQIDGIITTLRGCDMATNKEKVKSVESIVEELVDSLNSSEFDIIKKVNIDSISIPSSLFKYSDKDHYVGLEKFLKISIFDVVEVESRLSVFCSDIDNTKGDVQFDYQGTFFISLLNEWIEVDNRLTLREKESLSNEDFELALTFLKTMGGILDTIYNNMI